jgi:hypothetical protein
VSAMTPELQAQIAIWRQKAADNTLTQEEMKAAIIALRAGRVSAAYASETARRKTAKVAIPSAVDLLAELGEM